MSHEQFLTRATSASALTVLALERCWRGRYGATFVLLFAGMAVHR